MRTPARPADARGECDGCHAAPRDLWEVHGEPGEWQLCARCWSRLSTIPRVQASPDRDAGPYAHLEDGYCRDSDLDDDR